MQLPIVIYSYVVSLATNFRLAQRKPSDTIPEPTQVWTAPIIGFYKFNVDASFKSSDGKAWGGMVLRDFRSLVVVTARKRFKGITSALHVEIVAIHFDLEVVKQAGIRAQYVESDSMIAIKEINFGRNLSFPWLSLIFDVVSLKITYCVHSFNFVLRVVNEMPHKIVTAHNLHDSFSIWWWELSTAFCN